MKARQVTMILFKVRRTLGVAMLALAAFAPAHAGAADEVPPAHGIAMHGAPALPEDFSHLPYVDPDAPKGGRIT